MKRKDNLFILVKSKLERGLKILPDKPEESIESTVRLLWLKASGIFGSITELSNMVLPDLTENQVKVLYSLVEQRLNGKPLAYILGRQSFMGLELLADERALIPRRETEILGAKAIEICKDLSQSLRQVNIFDICCGSGNLGLILAHSFNNVSVIASDLSSEAVELTAENISLLGLKERIEVIQSDMFSAFESSNYYGRIDLIVCNPPYISSSKVEKMDVEISEHEPKMAFDGGLIGIMLIQRLIKEAPKFLSPGGWLMLEVGKGQGPFISQMIKNSQRFEQVEVYPEENSRVIYASC